MPVYSSESCPICLEEWCPSSTVAVTPCGHLFHARCLQKWHETKLKVHVPPKCPTCETDHTKLYGPLPRYISPASMGMSIFMLWQCFFQQNMHDWKTALFLSVVVSAILLAAYGCMNYWESLKEIGIKKEFQKEFSALQSKKRSQSHPSTKVLTDKKNQ